MIDDHVDRPMGLAPLGKGCECVATHSPAAYIPARHHIIPESWGGPSTSDNYVMLCSNSHYATHRLIDEYVRNSGTPPWEVMQHFNAYVRKLAAMAWDGRPDKPTITSLGWSHGHG